MRSWAILAPMAVTRETEALTGRAGSHAHPWIQGVALVPLEALGLRRYVKNILKEYWSINRRREVDPGSGR